MAKKGLGLYSTATIESLRRAEGFQAQAVMYIKQQFAVEDDEELKLEGLTWDKFIRQLESSDKNGTSDEFERQIADLLGPVVEAVMQQSREQR